MALKNVLIAVSDIDRSKKFYHDLFGLTVLREFEGNVMLTEGLVLQDKGLWADEIHDAVTIGNGSELFFEEVDFDVFMVRAKEYVGHALSPSINSWNKRNIRFTDPDGHLIEVAEK